MLLKYISVEVSGVSELLVEHFILYFVYTINFFLYFKNKNISTFAKTALVSFCISKIYIF